MPWWAIFSVHAVLDEEGRPLGEHRAPRDLAGAAPTQLKRCAYAGSRHHHALPMNASALRQTSQHWDEVVAGIDFLHRASRACPPPLTLAQLWRTLAAAAVLPGYLLHRQSAAPGPCRPQAFVAAIYKASLGIKFMLESHLLREILDGRAVDRPADVEALAALSEESGALIGVEQVCAAPANMIGETLRAFVQGGEPDARRRSPLADLLGPWAHFSTFTRAARDLYSTLLAFSTLTARVQIALEGASSGAPAAQAAPPGRESSPLEVSMSITLGMRRLRWPLASLDEARCFELLQAFCRVTSGEDGADDPATALSSALTCAAAVRRRRHLARRLEQELAPRRGGRLERTAAQLLAWQFDLENVVASRVHRAQRRMNDALGREPADEADALALAAYCAVSPWQIATAALGVRLEHEPGAEAIRCADGQVAGDSAPAGVPP